MSTPAELTPLSPTTLASLLFELASQLHIERARRMALEAALAQRSLLTAQEIEQAGASPTFQQEACSAADQAIRKLLRVLSESPDERVPLRAEAPGTEEGDT